MKVQKTKKLKDDNHFEMTDKRIGFAGAVALSEALKTNPTLSKITLNSLIKGSISWHRSVWE